MITPNVIFNATVCVIGVLVLFIHTVNILFKKDRRKDENALLLFIVFTMFHFAIYFTFTMIKINYTSKALIIAFYTSFYIMNNIELLLFVLYFRSYIVLDNFKSKIFDIINYSLFTIFVISDILNIFFPFYFTATDSGKYQRLNLMILSQGYQFLMLFVIFLYILANKHLSIREKTAFSMYCVLPLISIIVQNLLEGYAIAYATLFLSIEILFLFLNIERNNKLIEEEKQLKDMNMRIMVSQIQPHFVYNTLSSISTLIPLDPNKAQKALDDFSHYLRMNFSTLTDTRLIPFENELKHIKTYVELEKMRFNERLKVIYNIKSKDFSIPPLSIQPLVENAVKHGILKKVEGGTLTINTYDSNTYHIIEVIDDGVGFNIDQINFKDNKHIGIVNVKQRIKNMVNGELSYDSHINEGTKVIVKIHK